MARRFPNNLTNEAGQGIWGPDALCPTNEVTWEDGGIWGAQPRSQALRSSGMEAAPFHSPSGSENPLCKLPAEGRFCSPSLYAAAVQATCRGVYSKGSTALWWTPSCILVVSDIWAIIRALRNKVTLIQLHIRGHAGEMWVRKWARAEEISSQKGLRECFPYLKALPVPQDQAGWESNGTRELWLFEDKSVIFLNACTLF